MTALEELVAAELAEPVDPRVSAMAAAIAAAHPGAARAVLFYGSCLREQQLDGLMLDFYLIVSDYRAAYPGRWLAAANRLIPPNVFPFAHEGLAAKYAVLSEADFARQCSAAAATVSVWARFSQPARLVWTADVQARPGIVTAVARAILTLLEAAAMPAAPPGDVLNLWKQGFASTYAAELRAERSGRSASVVDMDSERYRRMAIAAFGSPGWPLHPAGSKARWRRYRWRGKLVSILRLAKASFTFAGGIDYLAWKINRHAGTAIEIRPWQRRWPLLGAVVLVPRLFLRGAIR